MAKMIPLLGELAQTREEIFHDLSLQQAIRPATALSLTPRHTRIFMLWWCIDPWHLMDIQCQTVPRAYDVSRVGRNSANVQVHATV